MRSRYALVVIASVLLVGAGCSSGAGNASSPTSAGTGVSHMTASVGKERDYFIAADEVKWDYAPLGSNAITGQPFDDVADTYVKAGPDRIGSAYTKCLYRGYADASFKTQLPRDAKDAYLGFLGPVIRAEVGDTIKVVFKNNCSFPNSVHPHGVLYAKDSEGAPYNDGTAGADKTDDAVPTGGRHTYNWQVPERAGPGPHDGSSVMWMYHSHTDEIQDTYSGLMGPIEITTRGEARADGSPVDVDREVFELFSVMNENKTHYIDQEIKALPQPPADPSSDDFNESNLMHSINGYVFGNGPMVTVKQGQRVRWYVMSMGTEVDLHTPHWHGNTVTVMGQRMDTVQLLPAGMVVADMVPDDAGIWLFHCHVNDHITAGMLARYQVVK